MPITNTPKCRGSSTTSQHSRRASSRCSRGCMDHRVRRRSRWFQLVNKSFSPRSHEGAKSNPRPRIASCLRDFVVQIFMMTRVLEIIPSIDLRGGKVVRLKQGDYDQQLNYDVPPIATAQ